MLALAETDLDREPMRLLSTTAYRGPNPHARHPVVHARLAVEGHERARHADLAAALRQALPGLGAHPCARGCPVASPGEDASARIAHQVEHVARELLRQAGQRASWGQTCPTREPSTFALVVGHEEPSSGALAVELAVELCEALLEGHAADVPSLVRLVAEARRDGLPGPSTASVIEEARRRGIPVLPLDDGSFYQLGHGVHQQRIQATMTGRTSAVGVEIVDDKERTKRLLEKIGVPVAPGETVRTREGAVEVAGQLGYPVVVKPLVGNHGRGVTTDVRTPAQLLAAFDLAAKVHPRVLVEKHLEGRDFRLLVVGHRLVAAARRDPAHVVGDGVRTVAQLVERENLDPRRGDGHDNVLTRIVLDEASLACLQRQGLAPESVPAPGRVVPLKTTANLSAGGTATDVTDEVDPDVREMAERISHQVGLDICGIDIVAPHLHAPLRDTGGGVCEVNAAPGFRMHVAPSHGTPRNVAGPVLDMLFPPGAPARIPLVAVTGTNGKTTTARLVAHILQHAGGRVGLATTTGVEVAGRVVLRGDYAGPQGAETVLTDPTVTHAVLEVARGGILRRGLGFDACDVALLLNVESDHLGVEGIDTLDDLARLKATVVRALRPGGTAVLNADDPLSVAARGDAPGPVVLFSLRPDSPLVAEHVARGGAAVTSDGESLLVHRGAGQVRLALWRDVPVTLEGRALFNVQNVLAATAAAVALGVPEPQVARALATFHPTPQQSPGRLNLLERGGVKVLVDYGHNPAALRAIGDLLHRLPARRRVCAGNGSGNRRDEDLREFGTILAGIYDEVVLSDPDPRGRELGETPRLIQEAAVEAGMPPGRIHHAASEEAAMEAALALARPGDLVVLQADDHQLALRVVDSWVRGARPDEAAAVAEAPAALASPTG